MTWDYYCTPDDTTRNKQDMKTINIFTSLGTFLNININFPTTTTCRISSFLKKRSTQTHEQDNVHLHRRACSIQWCVVRCVFCEIKHPETEK